MDLRRLSLTVSEDHNGERYGEDADAHVVVLRAVRQLKRHHLLTRLSYGYQLQYDCVSLSSMQMHALILDEYRNAHRSAEAVEVLILCSRAVTRCRLRDRL